MKRSTLVFPVIAKFDVFDLKKVYIRNFSLGMTAAVLIHFLFIGVYYFFQTTAKRVESKPPLLTVTITEQPTINIPVEQPNAVSSSSTSFKNATPVPVPEDKAVIEDLLPTQKELSSSWANTGDITGDNANAVYPGPKVETKSEVIPDIKDFTPNEKSPEIIESVNPVYPELALRAGLEGTVFVKVLIGKDGRPLKAVAVKFDSEVFVKPSIDAALKFIFTPAIQHKAPVMIWMTVPFKFRLNN
jgi:TonB family protein